MELDVDRIIEAIRSGTVSQAEGAALLSRLAERVPRVNGRDHAAPVHPAADPVLVLVGSLQQMMAETLDLDPFEIEPDANMSEYGFDSTTLVEFAQAITRRHPLVQLEPTTFFEHPTLSALASWIVARHGDDAVGVPVLDEEPALIEAGVETVDARTPAEARTATLEHPRVAPRDGLCDGPRGDPPIAIVGFAGRFPRCDSVPALWRALVTGEPLITEVPTDRWRWQDYFGDPAPDDGRTDCRHGAFIDDVACFDATHFGIAADEARQMDPQHRLLLEVTWEAIETAGCSRSTLAGSRVGVFIGTEKQEYLDLVKQAGSVSGHALTGNAQALMTNRVSHFFDWRGPSVVINTACSSSLVAIDAALASLRRGDVDLAIAGGVNLLLTPWLFIVNRRLRLLTGDSVMKPFDRRAAGHVSGEGIAVVVLKRVDDAERDRDLVYAAIRGSSVRHGGRSLFLMGRSSESQRHAIDEALQRSGLGPQDIDGIEAQGMADPVVDRTELMAYHDVFGRAAGERVRIGSSSGAIGHLGSASGVTALIKSVLSLRNNTMAPIRGLDALNWSPSDPPFGCAPMVRAEAWPPKIVDGARTPRRIGVQNFGLGGVHAHVIVEEWLQDRPKPRRTPDEVIAVLSARTRRQVLALAERLQQFLIERTYELYGLGPPTIAEIAYTLQVGRDAMECRAAFVVRSVDDVIRQLVTFTTAGASDDGVYGECSRVAPHGEHAAATSADDPRAIARAWIHGSRVDWNRLWPDGAPSRIPLPTYPFERQRHWIAPAIDRVETTIAPAVPRGDRADASDSGHETRSSTIAELKRLVAEVRGLDVRAISDDTSLVDLGFDSVGLCGFATRLSTRFGVEINPALFFSHSTVRQLGRYLADTVAKIRLPSDSAPASASASASVSAKAAAAHESSDACGSSTVIAFQAPVAPSRIACEPIAVIGMSGRFPGAADVDALWRLLSSGENAVREIPRSRFEWRDLYVAPGDTRNRIATNRGGFVDDVDVFDPLFFDISPREAELMDPRHRLLLEEAWRALEDAAVPPRGLRGRRVGTFVGVEEGDFDEVCGQDVSLTGNHPGVLATRLAYFLDLRGPSLAINTSCSSGLVALHQACQALQRDECELAFAAGVSLLLGPTVFRQLSQMSMLSPSGQCFTFSDRADGIVPAEAVVVLVLKGLSRAVADGDRIHGVIRATGINGDGRSNGITAPNGDAQRELIARTYERAGIDAGAIGYVLAHGTGTRLGDPIEVAALDAAFSRHTARTGSCALGSVKTNIGHSFAASGLVSVVAALQAMRHAQIPPTLFCERENDYLSLDRTAFYVAKDAQAWHPPDGARRMAAVSAFGISGTNAHVVIEEYAALAAVNRAANATAADDVVVPLSARTAESLRELVRLVLMHVQARVHEPSALADLAYTLQVGRESWEERVAFVVRDEQELIAHLRDFIDGGMRRAGCFHRRVASAGTNDIASLLDGDTELGEIVARWIEQRRLGKLAGLWASGVAVDWEALYRTGPKPRRVAVPPYPFARRRCWPRPAGDLERATPLAPVACPPLDEPLVNEPPVDQAPVDQPPVDEPPTVPRVTLSPLRRARARVVSPMPRLSDLSSSTSPPSVESSHRAGPPLPDEPQRVETPRSAEATRPSAEAVEAALTAQLAAVLFLEPHEVDRTRKFIDLGLDSILAVEWVNVINRTYGIRMAATELYDHATLRELARWLTHTRPHVTETSNASRPIAAATTAIAPAAGPAVVTSRDASASVPGDEQLQDLLRRLAAEELSVDDAERRLAAMALGTEPTHDAGASPAARDRVFGAIERSVRAVLPGLDGRSLSAADTLVDLGATSADRADIIVMTMEALALDIPCVELHGARNLGELADRFLQHLTCVDA